MHTRRRRITAESSVGRESFTCVSRLLQLGQRIRESLYFLRMILSENRYPLSRIMRVTDKSGSGR
jgi:hypothetical protein